MTMTPSIDLNVGTTSLCITDFCTANSDVAFLAAVGADIPTAEGSASTFQRVMAEPIAENAALGEAFAAAVAATVAEPMMVQATTPTETPNNEPVAVEAGEDARPQDPTVPVVVEQPVVVERAVVVERPVVEATPRSSGPVEVGAGEDARPQDPAASAVALAVDLAPSRSGAEPVEAVVAAPRVEVSSPVSSVAGEDAPVVVERPVVGATPRNSEPVEVVAGEAARLQDPAAPAVALAVNLTPSRRSAEVDPIPIESQVPVAGLSILVAKEASVSIAVSSVFVAKQPTVYVAHEETLPLEKPVLESLEKPVSEAVSPVVAKPVRNLEESEKAEALVASGVAPKTVPQPVAAAVPETAPAPVITAADIVRTQAIASVAATAAPTPTPATVLVEAAQAVADTLLVSPGLLRGQGEIVVQLRPDVLDGTEVRIAVTGRQLDVQFRPTTVDMSVLLENGRAQIANHLSAKISTFNVTVDVRKKRA